MSRCAAAAAAAALLVFVLLLSSALKPRSTGLDARLDLAEAQRRLAAFSSRGAGVSAAGCPGPPSALMEPSRAAEGSLVLVTGGAGFIGSAVVEELLALGYRVRVLDNLSTGNASNLPASHPRLQLRVGDVSVAEDCVAAVAGVSHVLHLAAYSRVAPSLSGGAAVACTRANVEGTVNVLEAARQAGSVGRVVYAGSSTAYGGDQELAEDPLEALAHQAYGISVGQPLGASWEQDTPRPASPYAASKLAGELLATSYDATFGLHAVVLRLFMVYGPRERSQGPHATVVARFVAAAARGQRLSVEGDGEQTRDFVHVSDVARAFVLAMQARDMPRRAVINVGSGQATRVLELADMLSPGPHAHAPRRRLDMRHTLANTCAAQTLLGWAPHMTLREGVAQMLRLERLRLHADAE